MKRFFILISSILLIVSLSISALAAPVIDWSEYIDYTFPGIDYDINDVFISHEAVPINWFFYINNKVISTSSDSSFSYTFDDTSTVESWILYGSFLESGVFDVTSFEMQDSINFHFLVNGFVPGYVRYRYQTYFYDSSGNRISYRDSTWNEISDVGTLTVPVDLSSFPAGTVSFSLRFQFSGSNSQLVSGDQISLSYMGLSFEAYSPGTLVFDPMIIEPQDYLVNESSNGTTSTLYVSVPAEDITMQWHLLRNDDYSIIKQSYGNPFPVTFDRIEYDYWIDCLVYDKLDITDIVDGSTMTVDFDILPTLGDAQPYVGSVRYQVRYFDNAGNLLDNVNFFVVPDSDWFDETKLDLVIDKPAGAVSMSFYLQFMDVTTDQIPISFTLKLNSVNFVCDIPTMVRVQQETGRTNQLLNELVYGDHGFDSSGSNFGSDADNLSGAGDQMDDAMGSGMDSLGAMTNSPMFTGTLATLAGAMDAIFVGHEITICGVTANPFTLAATILAIAILLPLALKYVFRKRGSG